MGTGASLVEYETAASNSDKAQWPAAFAEIDKAVQEKKTAGVAEAEVLAYATEACASAALGGHLDKEDNAATGRGRLQVSVDGGAGGAAALDVAAAAALPAAASEAAKPFERSPRDLAASKVEWLSGVVVKANEKLLQTPTQTFVVLTDGSGAAHRAFDVGKALVKDDDTLTVMHVKSEKEYHTDEYKADAIMSKYDAELTGFLPKPRRHSLLQVKEDKVTTKAFISEWIGSLKPDEDGEDDKRRPHKSPRAASERSRPSAPAVASSHRPPPHRSRRVGCPTSSSSASAAARRRGGTRRSWARSRT